MTEGEGFEPVAFFASGLSAPVFHFSSSSPIRVGLPASTFFTHCSPEQPSRSNRMNYGTHRQQWEVAPLKATGLPCRSLKL